MTALSHLALLVAEMQAVTFLRNFLSTTPIILIWVAFGLAIFAAVGAVWSAVAALFCLLDKNGPRAASWAKFMLFYVFAFAVLGGWVVVLLFE